MPVQVPCRQEGLEDISSLRKLWDSDIVAQEKLYKMGNRNEPLRAVLSWIECTTIFQGLEEGKEGE